MGFILWPLACIASYWLGYFMAYAYPNKKLSSRVRHLIERKPKQSASKFWISVQGRKRRLSPSDSVDYIIERLEKVTRK